MKFTAVLFAITSLDFVAAKPGAGLSALAPIRFKEYWGIVSPGSAPPRPLSSPEGESSSGPPRPNTGGLDWSWISRLDDHPPPARAQPEHEGPPSWANGALPGWVSPPRRPMRHRISPWSKLDKPSEPIPAGFPDISWKPGVEATPLPSQWGSEIGALSWDTMASMAAVNGRCPEGLICRGPHRGGNNEVYERHGPHIIMKTPNLGDVNVYQDGSAGYDTVKGYHYIPTGLGPMVPDHGRPVEPTIAWNLPKHTKELPKDEARRWEDLTSKVALRANCHAAKILCAPHLSKNKGIAQRHGPRVYMKAYSRTDEPRKVAVYKDGSAGYQTDDGYRYIPNHGKGIRN